MPKIIILKGLPASGKSTFAKALAANDPTYVRVNKDDIRLEVLGGQWSQKAEKSLVLPERDRRIVQALENGQNVIVDDTNLAPKHENAIRALAAPYQATIEVKFFDVPLEECLARDAQRTVGQVGERVIRQMHAQFIDGPKIVPYQHQSGLPWCVICDLDGTLAFHEGIRDVYDGSKCHLDNLNVPVAHILHAMNRWQPQVGMMVEAPTIIYLSGRDAKWREQTIQFLQLHYVPFHGHLYMRPDTDKRKDCIVKQELFDEHVRGKFNVRFVLDDRNQVVELWRALGLTCLQVADGNF